MSLPEKGWQGYGRPGYRCHAERVARDLQVSADDAGHAQRELQFEAWRALNLGLCAAVNWRIAEMGGRG